MKPSPILCKRVKTRIGFSTKQVGKGFYRGTGTGSLGAHTPIGGYLIDYRKVKHFVKPDLKRDELTPFVSAELYEGYRRNEDARGNTFNLKYDGVKYLEWFKNMNETHYDVGLETAKRQAYQAAQESNTASQSSSSSTQEDTLYMEQENHPLRQQSPQKK